MAKSLAQAFAESSNALVVAPAGCGKTHLISEATLHCNGRQLILTHTHAGVKAIRDRMVQMSVPPDRYKIATLDSFALRFASAFPTLSGWTVPTPKGEQWEQLLPAAGKVLQTKVAEAILRASYTGIFVDEYQDCSKGQHDVVVRLASILPCRVLGDPLQSVFSKVNKHNALAWGDVKKTFQILDQLGHPHRWAKKNEALGKWLLEIRDVLLAGGEIDLQNVACVNFVQIDPRGQTPIECLNKFKAENETVVALRDKREQCHHLAGKLQNRFIVFEDAHCEDLMRWANKIDCTEGMGRVQAIIQFAQSWLTRLPKPAIASMVSSVAGKKVSKARRADLIRLLKALETVRDDKGGKAIVAVMDALVGLNENPMFKSREIWSGLRHAAMECVSNAESTLHNAAWKYRDFVRRNGRKPARRCLATPLLVKGLEFDHAFILNTEDFPDAEALYVCLTRASRSLTVLGSSTILKIAKPVN